MAQYANLTASAQVKIGGAKLKGIVVNSGSSPTVAVYNTDTGSTSGTTVLATMTFATVPAVLSLPGDEAGVFLGKGLYVVLGGSSPNVTIIYD